MNVGRLFFFSRQRFGKSEVFAPGLQFVRTRICDCSRLTLSGLAFGSCGKPVLQGRHFVNRHRCRHRYHHQTKGCFSPSHPPLPTFPRLHSPPKGHDRRYALRHALPLFRHPFLPRAPRRLELASVVVVVPFYLLGDRNGLVCQKGSVETTQFGVVAAVDDGHGRHVFSAQARDEVNVVPILCGIGCAVVDFQCILKA